MHRRTFIGLLAAGTAAATTSACTRNDVDEPNNSLIERVGLGLFSIPHLLEDDLVGSMELLASIGYREVELFGPYPFSVPAAHERWEGLGDALGFRQSGYFGRTAAELRDLLDRFEMTAPSIHIDLETLRTRMDETAEAAHVLGHRYVGISSIPDEERRTMDDYRRLADEFNEIGRRGVDNGFQFLYHNHGYGLAPVDGEIPLQLLLDRLDPAAVALEMDVYWTVAGGADPIEYLSAYPELYRLMHVKDMVEQVRFEGDGGDASQWMELFPYMANVGEGVLDLSAILRSAKSAGVQHFYVERDLAPEPEAMLRRSFAYLSALQDRA